MHQKYEDKIISVLYFFGLKKDVLVFKPEFDLYLISLGSDRFFDLNFCSSLEFVLNQILPKDVFLKVELNKQFSKSLINISDEVNIVVNQAKYYQKPIVLGSKNAFERRLKHLYVENKYKNIRHESVGDGDKRQIVIYPN